MRQTLFRVLLDQPWAVWAVDRQTGIEGVGIGIMVLIIGIVWVSLAFIPSMRMKRPATDKTGNGEPSGVGVGTRVAIVAGLLAVAPFVGSMTGRTSFPVFGYGFMLLLGFLSAILFSLKRGQLEGIQPDTIFDLSFWLLLPGILGGRLAYLIQKWEGVFAGKAGGDLLLAAVNLTEGGLVLMGAMVGGGIGFFAFCHRRSIDPLKLADIIVPSVFVGVGFGRLGCLLNGCCFGDPCSLPWAITFPHDSVPFNVLADRGFLNPAAAVTMPMHPTQVYSSINGFVLAWVTATYFHRRRHTGDVLALALILYPITRFTIEFLRNDELGQLGTRFTISQFYSLAMFLCGIGLYAFLNVRDRQSAEVTSAVATGT